MLLSCAKWIAQKHAMLFVVCQLFAAGTATAQGYYTGVPYSALNDEKRLWQSIMEEFYGPYDRAMKCWVKPFIDPKGVKRPYCMRWLKLDRLPGYPNERLLVVTGGFPIDWKCERGHCDDHPSRGAMGLIILDATKPSMTLVARNSLIEPADTYGRVPDETNVDVRQLNANGTFGWTVEFDQRHGDRWYTYKIVYGPIGDRIVELANVVNKMEIHNCNDENEPEKTIEAEQYSGKYEWNILFEMQYHGKKWYPLIIHQTGMKKYKYISNTYRFEFNSRIQTYEIPEAFPKEMNDD